MICRSGRSKKRSAGKASRDRSTLNSPRKTRPRLFLDENLCRCAEILDVLVRSGLPHLPHLRVFAPGTPDEEWVRWVAPLFDGVLGKDKAHRYTPREKHLIIELKLRVFTFSSGNLNGLKMAQLLKAALPQIAR